jgi:hypothetical protein
MQKLIRPVEYIFDGTFKKKRRKDVPIHELRWLIDSGPPQGEASHNHEGPFERQLEVIPLIPKRQVL